MAIDVQETGDFIAAVLVGLASLGIAARIIQQRYFSQSTAPERSAKNDAPLIGDSPVIRVYEMLKGYVTREVCDAKHDGLCDKLEMMRKSINDYHVESREYHNEMKQRVERLAETLEKHCQEARQ